LKAVLVRIKVDEDMPRAAVTLLRQAGFDDTKSVMEQEMGGWSDSLVWQAVHDEGRVFITADKGFGDIRVYPLDPESAREMIEAIEEGCERVDLDELDPLVHGW
jgi:Domain of unknown function (DUF5615)